MFPRRPTVRKEIARYLLSRLLSRRTIPSQIARRVGVQANGHQPPWPNDLRCLVQARGGVNSARTVAVALRPTAALRSAMAALSLARATKRAGPAIGEYEVSGMASDQACFGVRRGVAADRVRVVLCPLAVADDLTTAARLWSCVGGELRAVRPCSAIGCGGRWRGGVAQAASGELSRWRTSGGTVMTMRSWSSCGSRRTSQSRL